MTTLSLWFMAGLFCGFFVLSGRLGETLRPVMNAFSFLGDQVIAFVRVDTAFRAVFSHKGSADPLHPHFRPSSSFVDQGTEDPLDHDPLLEEFEMLEQEVRQRDCDHHLGYRIEVTTVRDSRRRFICGECNKHLTEELL